MSTTEAVQLLEQEFYQLQKTIKKSHEILDALDVDSTMRVGNLGRQLTLPERILLLKESLSSESLELAEKILESKDSSKRKNNDGDF